MAVREQVLTDIAISIADIPVVLRVPDVSQHSRLLQHYADFLVDPHTLQAPRALVDVLVRPGARFVPIEPGPWVIQVGYHDGRYTYKSYLETGSLDMTTRRGELVMAPEGTVENFLRGLYAWLALEDGGLLLHAAGLVRDGRGYVFFGASGSGKTTVTRLSMPQATVLSDDLVILRRCDGVLHVCGVPFRGALLEAPRVNARAPLAGLYRLAKAEQHRLEPLPRAAGIAELIGSAPFVVKDLRINGTLVAVCGQVQSALPVQRLHFRKDDGFWKVIDAQA